ncbi:hypothetical protein Aduo_005589 [Ancylostoma duodenale]
MPPPSEEFAPSEALLKLKTPCALTKAELINTVRKEYDSFRNHQQFLMDSSPKPVTREDLQPILDDQKRVHDTIARIEEKVNQNSKDLAQTMNAVELLTKEIQALREVHQARHTEEAQKEHSKESKRSTTPEPRVRSMEQQERLQRPDPRTQLGKDDAHRSKGSTHRRGTTFDQKDSTLRGVTEGLLHTLRKGSSKLKGSLLIDEPNVSSGPGV